MKECKKYKKEIVAFLSQELSEEKRNLLLAHLKQCPLCRQEFKELERVMKEAHSLQSGIDQTMASIDWGNLSRKITEFIYQKQTVPGKKD